MKRILYFTAGPQATTNEKAAIAALNVLAAPQYEVRVLNGLESPNYGAGQITGDFVAGTIPASYKDDQEAPIYPVFNPASPPAPPNLPATQAIVADEQVLDVDGGGTMTLTVVNSAITGVVYAVPATQALVSDEQVLDVDGGGTITLTIEDGVITGVVYAAGE